MSPIEDARLLFLSGDGDAIGNSSGLVGRNLMFHLQTNAIGIFDERLHGHRGRTVTHGFADFRGIAGDPDRPLGGVVEISGAEGAMAEAVYLLRVLKTLGKAGGPGFKGDRFKRVMRESPLRDRIVAMALQAEDAPQETNRVDLDPAVKDVDGIPVARITYQNHPWELATSDFYGPKLLDLLIAAGARFAVPAPRDEISASAHIMGTLRMGTTPSTSVCDPGGRLHDVGNLFCADGALFPTGSGYNPTMTIVAVASYVAGAMLDRASPERAIDAALPPLDAATSSQ